MRPLAFQASHRCVPVCSRSVLLTRQQGSNDVVAEKLRSLGVRPVELPLITFRTRPEVAILPALLKQPREWVTVTSPQAARVFMTAWQEAEKPAVKVATFEGTKRELTGDGLTVWVSETSNAESLAASLPNGKVHGELPGEVLYPASAKADSTLESGLRKRHFVVTRVDTYDTTTVESVGEGEMQEALAAEVLTFASPTAAKAWVAVTQERCDLHRPVACIGATTAKHARALGFHNVYYSEKPGIDGLVQSIVGILRNSDP